MNSPKDGNAQWTFTIFPGTSSSIPDVMPARPAADAEGANGETQVAPGRLLLAQRGLLGSDVPVVVATPLLGGQEGDGSVRREAGLRLLGVEEGGKVAVFMIDSNVDAQGDGSCKPDPQTCETLHMRVGDTMFFDVLSDEGTVTAQYQLDLVDIKRGSTGSASAARKAYAAESKAGRAVLRLRQESQGPLRWTYDRKRGEPRRPGARTAGLSAGVHRPGVPRFH